jgi:hypothetical protein
MNMKIIPGFVEWVASPPGLWGRGAGEAVNSGVLEEKSMALDLAKRTTRGFNSTHGNTL